MKALYYILFSEGPKADSCHLPVSPTMPEVKLVGKMKNILRRSAENLKVEMRKWHALDKPNEK